MTTENDHGAGAALDAADKREADALLHGVDMHLRAALGNLRELEAKFSGQFPGREAGQLLMITGVIDEVLRVPPRVREALGPVA